MQYWTTFIIAVNDYVLREVFHLAITKLKWSFSILWTLFLWCNLKPIKFTYWCPNWRRLSSLCFCLPICLLLALEKESFLLKVSLQYFYGFLEMMIWLRFKFNATFCFNKRKLSIWIAVLRKRRNRRLYLIYWNGI